MKTHPLALFIPPQKWIKSFAIINLVVLAAMYGGLGIYVSLHAPVIGEGISYDPDHLVYEGYRFWLDNDILGETLNYEPNAGSVYTSQDQLNLVIMDQEYNTHMVPVYILNQTQGAPDLNLMENQLLRVDSRNAYILLKYTYYSHEQATDQRQTFILRVTYNNGYSLSTLDTSVPKTEITPLNQLDNHTLVQVYPTDYYGDALVGVFRHNMFDSIRSQDHLANASYQDYLVIAQDFFTKLDDNFTGRGLLNPIVTVIEGQAVDEVHPVFDIEAALFEEFGEGLGLISTFNFKLAHIDLVDRSGILHVTGTSIDYNDVEGNSTGINKPDYLVIDPAHSRLQKWDILPGRGNLLHSNLEIIELESGEIVMVFVESKVEGYYDNPDNDPSLANLDGTWEDIKLVQAVRLRPFEPTDANYVQFDKSISGTADHSIDYPRAIDAATIDHIPTNWEFACSVYEDSLFVTMTHLLSEDGFIDHIEYVKTWGDGGSINRSIWPQTDWSLVSHSIQLGNTMSYNAYHIVLGPEHPVQSRYEGSSWYKNQAGWEVHGIFAADIDNGDLKVLFMGRYDFRTEPFFDTSRLRVISIDIEGVLL